MADGEIFLGTPFSDKQLQCGKLNKSGLCLGIACLFNICINGQIGLLGYGLLLLCLLRCQTCSSIMRIQMDSLMKIQKDGWISRSIDT